jgi:methyl-accepting chemotaxis protein
LNEAGANLVDSLRTAWTQTLVSIIADLEDLNGDTEQEFLRIGGEVAEFIGTVNRMSSDLSALAHLVSGEQGQRASEALTAVLERSRQMSERSEEGGRLLGKMQQQAGRFRQTLSQFSSTVATFHSLGLLTRIETARLGNAGADFGNLAEEVRLLARNVQTGVEISLDTAGELIPRIESALQEVSGLQQGQAKNLPHVISQVADSLTSFREMQHEARDASLRLGAEYAGISESFNRLIVSMQFNDITRQQLEHVIEVLKHFGAGVGNPDGASLLESAGAAGALELQSAQMANAGDKFSTSVASIARSLDEVSAHVVHMVEEGSGLSGLSGKSSSLRQMERGCSAILSGLTQCAGADAATRRTSDGLSEKIVRMRDSIEEIRTIEMQMRRIAMNARISAEHLGPAGEALSALANSIKQRATESRQGSDALLETLGQMRDAVQQLAEHAGPESAHMEAQDESLERMRIAVAELRSSQESTARQVAQIADLGDGLCRGIRAARAHFSIGARFAEVVGRTRERLKKVIDEIQASGFTEGDESSALALAKLAGRYTMQEQRDIHFGTGQTGATENQQEQSMEDSIVFF